LGEAGDRNRQAGNERRRQRQREAEIGRDRGSEKTANQENKREDLVGVKEI
jgi:hypothetical protein